MMIVEEPVGGNTEVCAAFFDDESSIDSLSDGEDFPDSELLGLLQS